MRFEAKTDRRSASVSGDRLHIAQFIFSSFFLFQFSFHWNSKLWDYALRSDKYPKAIVSFKDFFIEIDSSGMFRQMIYDTFFPDLFTAKPDTYHLTIRMKNKLNWLNEK